ncbi:MAG: hypothetical protein FWH20_00490 [Oscillospiraceae bacterium]|nr:hypothetical protein [Oscillospiraceae bacterium]
MDFQELVKRDIKAVFHNAKEHARVMKVEYNGESYEIPVIIDSEEARDRRRLAKDNGEGMFIAALTVYISFYDLGIVPRKASVIVIDSTAYTIAKAAFDEGEIILELEVLDE